MCVFSIGFGAFSVIFVHFLQKYRCVSKFGFSADISIDIFIGISIDNSIYMPIDISIDNFIDMLVDMLTDKEEGGGRRKEERSGLLLKI